MGGTPHLRCEECPRKKPDESFVPRVVWSRRVHAAVRRAAHRWKLQPVHCAALGDDGTVAGHPNGKPNCSRCWKAARA